MNYKTYAEAKIANPDSEIVTTGKSFCFDKTLVGIFQVRLNQSTEHAGWHCISDDAWVICNPADHCSSLKEFLDAGLTLCCGDIILDETSSVNRIASGKTLYNKPEDCDETIFMLSSAALGGDCKIPDKEEQWSVYNNAMPLSELTDEQYGKMRRMHDNGATAQSLNEDGYGFQDCALPTWISDGVYRIKPKSERELFIEAAITHGIKPEAQSPKQIFGELFDSGKFKYIDNTQHFGENI